jgi:lysozyme
MSLIEEIKRHEGYSKKVYKDTLGYDTIGIGFLVSSLELDEDVCDTILERRLIKNERVLQNKLPWYIDKPQLVKNILQNMYYQLGNRLFDFVKTLHYIEHSKYRAGAVEMLDSLWAKQTPNRAKELSKTLSEMDE